MLPALQEKSLMARCQVKQDWVAIKAEPVEIAERLFKASGQLSKEAAYWRG
jgi:hypothetical protein